jgi:GMP synthase PP-ATPase subunit
MIFHNKYFLKKNKKKKLQHVLLNAFAILKVTISKKKKFLKTLY